MNKVILIGVGAGVAGAATGSVVTYFVARKRLEKKAFAWANEEIESIKDTYKLLRKEPPYDNPETAARAYMARMDELQHYAEYGVQAAEDMAEDAVAEAQEQLQEAEKDLEGVEEIIQQEAYSETLEEQGRARVRNIFDAALTAESFEQAEVLDRDGEVDRGDELSRRDPHPPHVITPADFFDDSNEFEKITISYYEGDDTLADERDNPIPDVEGVVGRSNLSKFGEESDSKDTVYIRNERLQIDYEVVRDDGDFATVVYGQRDLDDHRQRVKKMRNDE